MKKNSGSAKKLWKPPSFEDFDAPVRSKRSQPDTVDDSSTWNVEPLSAEQLATPVRKVEEVRAWLVSALSKPQPGILLITGPTGSGKTCSVKLMAEGLDLDVREWVNPVEKVDYKRDIMLGVEYDASTYGFSDNVDKFEWFVYQASQYKGLFSRRVRSVVLVEDFPNKFLHQPSKFHEFLGEYVVKGGSPIIFICTDDGNMNTANELFPGQVKDNLKVTTIKFNPVTKASTLKTLKRVVGDSYGAELTQETLESIYQSSNGDIRSAISGLQLLLTGVEKQPAKKRKKVSKGASLKPVAVKDKQLDFFSAVGRVLYPKTLTSEEKSKFDNKERVFVRDVNEIADSYSQAFLLLLHQNYPLTFSNLSDMVRASDWLSVCDTLGGSDELLEYAAFTSVVGLMTANTQPNRRSFQPLKKSAWKSIDNKTSKRSGLFVTEKDVTLDVAPYLKIIPKSLMLEARNEEMDDGSAGPGPEEEIHIEWEDD